MGTNGIVREVAINPVTDMSGDSSEVYFPDQIELRNGSVTPLRNWRKRFGYQDLIQLPENSAISLLIPFGVGFAVLENGSIYRLDSQVKLAISLRGNIIGGTYKPTYVIHDDIVIICDGGRPVKIVDNQSSLLDDAPRGKFCARIGSYTVISGYEDLEGDLTEFRWCAADNPENWTTGDSGFDSIRKDGGTIYNMVSTGQYIYFLKDNNTEVWSLVGGAFTFGRHESACFNIGVKPDGFSVVRSIDSITWLGNTGDFWSLSGGQTQIISAKYKEAISGLFDYDDLIGYDFYEEYKIRWFSKRHGRCFVYDYLNKVWSEENSWGSDWERLPINSQMYFSGKCYVGSSEPDGKIFEWGKNFNSDNGKEIRSYRKFRVYPFAELSSAGTITKIRLRLKRGVSTVQETEPTCLLRMRADKAHTWFSKYFNLGASSDQTPFIDVFINLYGNEFEFEITETDAVTFIVTGLELTLKPGGIR